MTVPTTVQRTVVPEPIPDGAPKLLPVRALPVRGVWVRTLELRPRPSVRTPAGPPAGRGDRAGRAGRCAGRRTGTGAAPAPALLHHHRHPHHRRAVAGAGHPVRVQGVPVVGVLGCDALHAPRAGRGRAVPPTRSTATTLSTSASPWATRATPRSTTSSGGTSTCWTAGASIRIRGSRRAAKTQPRAAFLDAYRATGLDPSIPWYQTRGNHDHFWTGFLRVNDYLRETYIGERILDLGNVFEDPLGPDSRGFYMGCLDGRTPYGDIFGLGPVAGFPTPPPSSPPTPTAAR